MPAFYQRHLWNKVLDNILIGMEAYKLGAWKLSRNFCREKKLAILLMRCYAILDLLILAMFFVIENTKI